MYNRRLRFTIAFSAVLLLAALGCNPAIPAGADGGAGDGGHVKGPDQHVGGADVRTDATNDVRQTGSLPRLPPVPSETGSECDSLSDLSLEEWLSGPDLIVMGTVASVEPILDDIWLNDNDTRPMMLSECVGGVGAGLRITLTGLTTLTGSASERVTFVIGRGLVGWWTKRFSVPTGTTDVVWSDDDYGIVPGQKLGALLYFNPNAQLYTPGYAPLFEVHANGDAFFQSDEVQCTPVPPELLGGNEESLIRRIRDADRTSVASDTKADARRRYYAPAPQDAGEYAHWHYYFHASMCNGE